MSKWFFLYVQGLIDERQCSYSYALKKYQAASEYVPDKTEINIRIAQMMIKLNDNSGAKEVLANGTDAVSRLLSILIDFLMKVNTRPKSELEKVQTDEPYERALADLIRGMAEFYNGVSKRAAENYAEGIKELKDSIRRRDVLMRVNLYRRHAEAILKIDHAANLSDANEDYEAAIELLMTFDDSSPEIREFLEMVQTEKATANTTTTDAGTRGPETVSGTQVINMDGMQVIVSGSPMGAGGRYKVYRAKVNNDPYAFRILKNLDPYHPASMNIPINELKRLSSEVNLWKQISDECPDHVVKLIAKAESPFPSQLMEMASTSYDKIERSLSQKERIGAIIEMLDCLQAVHETGLVHNDIKPENMMQIGGRWKLADFDLSFWDGDEPKKNQGTFDYMSPEHFGEGDVCQASDIWAMGVLLYHALSGMLPFAGKGDEYKSNVLEGAYNTGAIRESYVPLFNKVFSKKPEDRPSAAGFADELRSMIGGAKEVQQ